MTREELEALVTAEPHLMGTPGSTVRTLHDAIVQLADERDAAIKRAEEVEASIPAMQQAAYESGAATAQDQRDRALALLRDGDRYACSWAETSGKGGCRNPSPESPCWEHRRRALLAEVDR